MGWQEIMALAVGLPMVFFPVAYVYSIVGGGIYEVARGRRSAKGPTCSIDADCPPGYICVNGRCVRAES